MKKILILIIVIIMTFSGCNTKQITDDEVVQIIESGKADALYKNSSMPISSTDKKNKVLAQTVINLTAFDREHESNFITDNVLQIIAVKQEDIQNEFDCYYLYEGEAIGAMCEAYDLDAIHVKTIDEDGSPLFEFCFTENGTSYMINPDYVDSILIE